MLEHKSADSSITLDIAEGIESITNIWNKVLGSYTPPLYHKINDYQNYLKKIARKAITISAYCGAEAVGAISFYANDNNKRIAYITQFAVDSAYQGKGIGSALLKRAIDLCSANGMKTIQLEVEKSNLHAQSLYLHYGFVWYDDKLPSGFLMQKEIMHSHHNA